MKTFDLFCEKWEELTNSEKINLFIDYCNYEGCDDMLYIFDDDFFDVFFEGRPLEAVRAAHFGNISWNDEYIKFNGYGNLETLSEWAAADLASDYKKEIFELGEYDDYICIEEEENEVLTA